MSNIYGMVVNISNEQYQRINYYRNCKLRLTSDKNIIKENVDLIYEQVEKDYTLDFKSIKQSEEVVNSISDFIKSLLNEFLKEGLINEKTPLITKPDTPEYDEFQNRRKEIEKTDGKTPSSMAKIHKLDKNKIPSIEALFYSIVRSS